MQELFSFAQNKIPLQHPSQAILKHQNMKLKQLIEFYKTASLKSDMAHRIMYEAVKSIDPKSIHYHALKYAVAGAKNIIKFGTKACVDEIQHYEGKIKLSSKTVPDEVSIKTIDVYIDLLNEINNIFGDEFGWEKYFGGKNWKKISEKLLSIAVNYKNYLLADETSDDKIKFANLVIIAMNVFDGFAHNTGLIINKMLEEENPDLEYKDIESVKTMMDAKELKNLGDVIDVIKPELITDMPYSEKRKEIKELPRTYSDKELLDISDKKEVQRKLNIQKNNMIDLINLINRDIPYQEAVKNFGITSLSGINDEFYSELDWIQDLLLKIKNENVKTDIERIKQIAKDTYEIRQQFPIKETAKQETLDNLNKAISIINNYI